MIRITAACFLVSLLTFNAVRTYDYMLSVQRKAELCDKLNCEEISELSERIAYTELPVRGKK